MIAEPALQAAWETFLVVRAVGGSEHEALVKAIEAADKRRAKAVIDALRKKKVVA